MSFHPENLPSDSPDGMRRRVEPGNVLADRFEVVARLAEGGMGEVFRVTDREAGIERAVKMMHGEINDDPELRSRFEREAEIATTLSHQNIVRTLGLYWHGATPLIVMELLAGHSLREECHRKRACGARFTEEELRSIARQSAAGLDFAHQRIVHRDIKPENIWVTESKIVCLMDFGLAAPLDDRRSSFTRGPLGTDRYIAPEQRRGGRADARADQYSLGVVLYELATGEPPAARSSPLREIRRDLSRNFCAAVERSLSSRPEDRFPSMSAFAKALDSRLPPVPSQWLPAIGGVAVAVLALATSPLWWPSAVAMYRSFTVDTAQQNTVGLVRQSAETQRDYYETLATQRGGRVPDEIRILAAAAGELLQQGTTQEGEGSMKEAIASYKDSEAKWKDASGKLERVAGRGGSVGGPRSDPETSKFAGTNQTKSGLSEDPTSVHASGPGQRKSLHEAVLRSDRDLVRTLLDGGADPNAQDTNRDTPLHLAITKDEIEIIRLLLERSASTTHRDVNGRTALHKAIARGSVDAVQLLLNREEERHALLRVKANNGDLPIHTATREGNGDVLELLRIGGADFGAPQTVEQLTPLLIAIGSRKPESALWMLKNIEPKILQCEARSAKGETALHLAVQIDGFADIVTLLVEKGANQCARDKRGALPSQVATSDNKARLTSQCP
jgi:serine/threonine protein kinase